MKISYSHYLDEFTSNWHKCRPKPFNGKIYSEAHKIDCELFLEKIQSRVKLEQESLNSTVQNEALIARSKSDAHKMFENLLGFTPDESAIILSKSFTRSTRDFVKMAREFDPMVSWEDIFQAGRNVWIVNSLQFLMNEPIEITPALFAYSMLYPYTDNYLDDCTISAQSKHEFSLRFRERLSGRSVESFNLLEDKIFALVGMVEEQFDRVEFPGVYKSLLAIHDAQTRSIELTTNNKSDIQTLISICIDKGGTSVLADGYLINGTLTPEQEHFMYGFGVYLQFIDDLQDVSSDLREGVSTMFTQSALSGELEQYWQKTIDFGQFIYNDLGCFSGVDREAFGGLMNKSTHYMLVESVAKNKAYYKQDFISEIEIHSPIHFDFILKRRQGINKISILNQIRTLMASNEAEYSKMVG